MLILHNLKLIQVQFATTTLVTSPNKSEITCVVLNSVFSRFLDYIPNIDYFETLCIHCYAGTKL